MNIKTQLFFAWLMLIVMTVGAQTVRFINKTTLQPIENVSVKSIQTGKIFLSNQQGEIHLKGIRSDDSLWISHPFYHPLKIAMSDLPITGYTIKMIHRTVILNEVVISSSRWEQMKKEVPNKIVSLDAGTISFLNPQTSADMLAESGEIYVQKSQLGGGSPMLRGFAANSVLIVVDGVRMNNAIYRSGNLQNVINVDPNVLEKTEVILGPGTVIYGSDALGGVMHFTTRKLNYTRSQKNNVQAQAFLRYSTADNENTAHIQISAGTQKLASFTAVSYSNFSDLRTGAVRSKKYPDWGKRTEYVLVLKDHDSIVQNPDPNIQVGTGYNMTSLIQKIGFKPTSNFETTYGFYYSTTSDIPRYDRLSQYKNGQLKYAEWYYGPQKWMMHRLGLRYDENLFIFDQSLFTFAYQKYKESRHTRNLNNPIRTDRVEDVDVVTFNLDLYKKLHPLTQLYYGYEGAFNHVSSSAWVNHVYTGATGPASTRYPDGGSKTRSHAFYMSIKHNLNSKVTLLAGGRFSDCYLYSSFIDTYFYHFPFEYIELKNGSLNGGISVIYRPADDWQLNYNLSSGFRAPNVDDVAKVFDSEPGVVIVPNDNLKPEHTYNAEFSLLKSFADKAKAELTLFYTHINDAMVRRDFQFQGQDSIYYDGVLSKVEALVNTGEAFIAGGSFKFIVDLWQQLSLKASFNYLKGKDQIDNVPLRHVPPPFGKVEILYSTDHLKVSFYSRFSDGFSYDELAPSEQDKPHLYAPDGSSPAWFTLNTRAFYQVNRQVQISMGIENILDRHYRTYSSGVSAPGRNFYFALKAFI